MKVNLKRRITTFLYLRSHNWQQRLCLITFMVLCLSVVILGVPMHMAGLIGRGDTTLYAISAVTWVATVAIVALFIMKRMRLNVAISTFGIMTQLAESTRIVYAAVVQPEGFADTILFNQIISLALIIYLVMAAVRHTPTATVAISIATLLFAFIHTNGGINPQTVAIFVIVEVFTCVLGELIRRGIRNMQRENDDYHTTISQLLASFHMTKTELLAYIQLGRGEQSDKNITDFFDRLDERTEANLIRAVEQRIAHRHMQRADISAILPTLTPTEQEVCRLIIGGKTITEIASILHKNANNVSSVRIHIRKKLGLAAGKDLREALLEVMQRK